MLEVARALGSYIDSKDIEAMFVELVHAKNLILQRVPTHIVNLLDDLRQMGLRLVLVSNCAPEDTAGWDDSPLASFFDSVVFSYREGLAKPDPKIYLLAAGRAQVDPAACLFVGDGQFDELTGALEAGMTPIQALWYALHSPFAKEAELRAASGACRVAHKPSDVLRFAIDWS